MPPREGEGLESNHVDRGKPENIISLEGKRMLGLEPYDVNAGGITAGQQKIRQVVNEALGF
jgi:hypothetical protein